jgi:hypothetical protein
MKAKKRGRNFSRPALMGSFQQPIPLRAAAINAPTATYTAIPDASSDNVKQVLAAGQEQKDQENAKAQQDAIINEQKRKEYLQQQADKEATRRKRGGILHTVGSIVGTLAGAEFGMPGVALGSLIGGAAGDATEALIENF